MEQSLYCMADLKIAFSPCKQDDNGSTNKMEWSPTYHLQQQLQIQQVTMATSSSMQSDPTMATTTNNLSTVSKNERRKERERERRGKRGI